MIHGHIGKLFLRIPQLPGFTIHVLVTKIKNICQDGFMIIQICIVLKGWLVVLRLNVPVNNFSVISGRILKVGTC